MKEKEPIKMNLKTALLIIIVIETILLGYCFYQLKLKGEAKNEIKNSVNTQKELSSTNTTIKHETKENGEDKTNITKNDQQPKLEENKELKNFLGYIGDLNTYEDNNYAKENINKSEFFTNEKIMIASMFTKLERKNDYVTYNLSEIKNAAKEIFNENVDVEAEVKKKDSTIFYDSKVGGYIDGGGDASYSVYLVKIESQSNSNGIYDVTFLYGYVGEGDFTDNTVGDCDCYRTTVKIKVNDNYKYSKYQLVNTDLSGTKVGKIKDFDDTINTTEK